MERNLFQELKVGLFVLGLIGVILLSVYILGGSSEMFAHEFKLHTSFADVKGLKAGAVVRLAGIDVGQVSKVEFSTDQQKKEIEIEMTIRSEYQPRLRADSTASISQIGVLGDMLITLSIGDPEHPVLEDGARITSTETPDILSYASKATAIVENAASISKKVDLMLGSDEEAANAGISQSLANVEQLLTDAKNGKGLIHTLVYDEAASAKVKSILTNVDGITADVKGITTEVRTGKGLAHAVIYGEEGELLTRKLGDAADAVDGLMADLKNEDSLVHALLYDPEKASMMNDLQAIVANAKGVTDAVNEGEGTLGLLVRDPQMYEDVRTLLGGAQRNALLRAYVRATVARGKEETSSSWRAPEPPK